jgi:ferritin-like metal-binding protein YciE
MKIPSIAKLLEDQLKDLYSAETQLVKALPKLAKKAASTELKNAFTSHLEETKNHVERLTEIGTILGLKMTGKKCKAMEGLVEEGAEVLEAEGPGPVIDAALIAAAQRVEHYEISAYGSARALATHLGHENVAELLQETLDEESAADEKLTSISEEEILPNAAGVEDVAAGR